MNLHFSSIVIIIIIIPRSAVVNHGMWDQIRVDHGKEFYLSLFIQEMIEGYRNRRERQPYMQTQSTKVQYELNLHNIGKL